MSNPVLPHKLKTATALPQKRKPELKPFPYKLIAPRLTAFEDASLPGFIEAHFQALTPYLNWFTVELFFHCGVRDGLAFLDANASRRISTQKILQTLPQDDRFASVVMNNAGQAGYIEIQSKSGFIESVRRFIAAEALTAGASTADVAHLCGTSLRTVQRLQRTAPGGRG